MSASKDMQLERMRLASELWGRHISAEFTYKANPFMPEQMSHASSAGIPLGVVLRPEELKEVGSRYSAASGIGFRILSLT